MAEIDDLEIVDASNTDRFPEGQAPSTVNNGARALEGIVARWHKDTNGSKASTGSANAYVFAADQTLSAYYDGLVICFDANFTNTGAATLNVDAVSVDPIVWPDQTALVSGDIVSGAKITVIHDGTSWQLDTLSEGVGSLKEYVDDSVGLILLASATPSAAASVDITSSITATYKNYLLVFNNLIPATDDVQLWMRTSTDNGSTFDSGAGDYSFARDGAEAAGAGQDLSDGDATEAQIEICSTLANFGVGDGSAEGISGKIWIYDPLSAAVRTRSYFDVVYGKPAGGSDCYCNGVGTRRAAADVDAIQLLFESGNIASGEVRFYGVKDS